MNLFDNIARSFVGPRRHGESAFEFLNRSARPEAGNVRSVWADWYSHYPEEHRSDLRSRFRSKDNVSHISAAFELALHELMRRLEGPITVHPEADPTWNTRDRIDFRVRSACRSSDFLLEAITFTGQSREEAKRDQLFHSLLDEVERLLQSPDFFVHVDVQFHEVVISRQPSARGVAERIRQWLGGLDYASELTRSASAIHAPRLTVQCGGLI